MKRLLAIILAACFVLGGAMSAFAANVTKNDDRFRAYYEGAYRNGSSVSKIKRHNSVVLKFSVVDTDVVIEVPSSYKSQADDEGYEEFQKLTASEKLASYFKDKIGDYIDVSSIDVVYTSTALTKNGTVTCTPTYNQNGELCFDISIPVNYTGTGKDCEFDLTYVRKNKTTTADDGTVSAPKDELNTVTVTQTVSICEEYVKSEDDDDDDDEDLKPLTPYIIVSNYSYGGGGSVTAGNEFNLSLTLRNTSSELDLDNIIASLSPMGVFSVASSSNTFYIESLPAGGETTITARIKAGMTKVTDDDDANSINMTFRYQYTVDSTRNDGTSSESITIPVDYPDRFELGFLEASDAAYLGDSYSIYLPMVNKGRSSVYNLTAAITCEGVKAAQSQYIGNLAAGTESGADFTLDFTESGEFAGKITVTYEDANMDEHTVEQDFSVTVMSYEEAFGGDTIDTTGDEIIDDGSAETETGMSTKTKLLIGGGVAAAAVIAGTVIHKKRKEKDAVEDEEI